MIKSMTGFGRGDCIDNGYQFNIELKTINHRYTDFFIRMPRHISYLEERIKKYIQGYITRGRIEVYISLEYIDRSEIQVDVNIPLAIGYYSAIEKLAQSINLENNVTVMDIAKYQDVIKTNKVEEDEDAIWNALLLAMDRALINLSDMRKTEGEKLHIDITEKIAVVKDRLKDIEKLAPMVVEDYRNRLITRIKEWEKDNIILEESRIITEITLFADRSNVNEEIVRLKSHIQQFLDTLNSKEAVGRKLDFIVQEMNREINTIGSKANYIDITRNVVEIKSEIEKIREQIQNIE